MSKSVKYVAQVSNVREVSLLGQADLSHWTKMLSPCGFVPLEAGGFAQVLLMAAEMKFWGIPFGEVSFSVLVQCPEAKNGQGAFLLQAFNSNRFFAWTERTFFSAPYSPAEVKVVAAPTASIRLVIGGHILFEARMGAHELPVARVPLRQGVEGWSGPVFLPQKANAAGQAAKAFLADVKGETSVYSFAPADSLSIRPESSSDLFQRLVDSGFTGVEWSIRPEARHCKSKTYRRADLAALLPI